MPAHGLSSIRKRTIACVLSCAMVLGSFPVQSFAEDGKESFDFEPIATSASDDLYDVENAQDEQPIADFDKDTKAANDGVQTEDTGIPDADAPVEGQIDGDSLQSREDDAALLPDDNSSIPAEGDVEPSEFSEDVDASNEENEVELEAQAQKPSISYATHVQNIGWQSDVKDGKAAGTSGRSLRLESFHVKLALPKELGGGIEYRAQVQNKGWLSWVKDGSNCGTTGSSLRMEAIQLRLYGQVAEEYDIYYRVHLQNYGWMNWASNGALAGSTGRSLRLEAMQIVLVPKGENPPTASPASQTSLSFVDGTALSVSAHVQNVGWMRPVGSGKVAGTTGRSLRVEALRVSLAGARVPGGITGQAHVQNVGWQKWVGNGGTAGTSGRSLRVEAVRYKLTGEAADGWDLYDRVHVQHVGWLAWAKNGETAGSEGFSLRIEAVEFRLVPKGDEAPNNNGNANKAFLTPLGVKYAARTDASSWGKTVANGDTAGTTGKSKVIDGVKIQVDSSEDGATGSITYDLDVDGGNWSGWKSDGEEILVEKSPEAIRIKLTGDLANSYSVWYRVHLSNAGWL
ncbi:MAG: Ig domain-containing protein, partial [Eggerthellaceae bacterium]|nr:Ig domain-containing protein [Eggerthellaceae bacterium]